MKTHEFDDIRPYYDEEIPAAIERLLADPEFKRVIMEYVFPGGDWEQFASVMKQIKNSRDFQSILAHGAVHKFVGRSSNSIEAGGINNLKQNTAYTYISNHRDIVLDAAILAVVLSDNGFETMEIAIGDNLLLAPWIMDIVRINKSFIVKRGVSFREQLLASTHLSKYIHYTISEKHGSIWIAQREGRAKDSDDRTQESLLKMLAMGSDKPTYDSIRELNLMPVSLSYEYDPCDYLKAKELQQRRENPEFKKSQRDDLLNMETGLFGYKGRIHFHFARPINDILNESYRSLPKNELIHEVANMVDCEIFLNYRFYPINYLFYDRLTGENRFTHCYTDDDVKNLDAYLQQQLDKIDLPNKDVPFLREIIYTMYANPLKNYLSVK
jgi:Glycerol-3-phosphate O-acyltransferase